MGMQTSYIAERPALANRFSVIDLLGDGASSSVYLVADSKLNGQHVALKVLQNSEAFDEHTLKRFTAEMEICKEIHHPNIVEAYDLINLGDTIAFTMEYIRGADLLALFQQRERMSGEEIDRIFLELLSALQQLHQRDIVHRDLKLENVLIRDDGHVKLSDLGLMKRLDGEALTKPGLLLGTVHYMPPEYITQGSYDARGDLYGIAIMLLELVTKKRRMAALEGRAVIQELIKTRFVIPEQLLLDLPRKYQAIIRKGTAVEIEDRYQSVEEMMEDFQLDFSEFLGRETADMRINLDLDETQARIKKESSSRRKEQNQRLMKRVLYGMLFLIGAAISILFLSQ